MIRRSVILEDVHTMFNVENTSPDNFSSPVRSDLYQSCPASIRRGPLYIDPITGLTNGPAYRVGYFTLNPNGTMTFTRASANTVTTPSVTTVAASSVTATTAVLNASINPNGATTTFSFQYGTNTTYGSTTPVVTLASGTSAVSTNAAIGGLLASTTYHFRVVATNSGGFATGSDMTFTTPGNTPPPPPQLGSSAYGSDGFSFSFTSTPGTSYTAWGTTDISLPFNQWSNLGPVAVTGQGQYQFTEPSATNSQQRFYRVTQP